MLNEFSKKTVTYFMCNVKKGFPRSGMTELSKVGRIVILFYYIKKTMGYHDTNRKFAGN